jgi:hypothetical protein
MHKGIHEHSAEHPGFKAVVDKVEKQQGVSKETAEKEIGYAKAHASAAAKRANPRLNNTRGK